MRMRRKHPWKQWPLSGWLALAGGILLFGPIAVECVPAAHHPPLPDPQRNDLLPALQAIGLVLLVVALLVFMGERLSRGRLSEAPLAAWLAAAGAVLLVGSCG